MRRMKWGLAALMVLLALGTASLLGGATTAQGQTTEGTQGGPICGAITSTVTILRDAWLACDVPCSEVDSPCIQFGRTGIKLSLNGFKLTGSATPPSLANCVDLPPGVGGPPTGFQAQDGIHSGFDDVQIVGPGLVQNMRRHGIALVGNPATSGDAFVDKAQVKKVTSHQNCYSGVFLSGVKTSLVNEVVSVRNAAASRLLPCGGICITNSHDNVIRRNELAGNGSAVPGITGFGLCPVAVPNDFGVGLTGNSSGNLIEENGLLGNINGVFVCPGAANNLIKKNVIAGNPPMQVSASFADVDPVGADIRDFSPTGANRFEENLCITSTPPGMCANLPQFAGHQNN